jgi:hypothetical protein
MQGVASFSILVHSEPFRTVGDEKSKNNPRIHGICVELPGVLVAGRLRSCRVTRTSTLVDASSCIPFSGVSKAIIVMMERVVLGKLGMGRRCRSRSPT